MSSRERQRLPHQTTTVMMKRPQPAAASTGGIERAIVAGLKVLVVTYAVVAVRTFSSLNTSPAFPPHFRGADDAARPIDGVSDGSGSPPSSMRTGGMATDDSMSPEPFPQSAINPDEYETIIHPASEVMLETSPGGSLNGPIHMTVPKFWDPDRFESVGGVRQHLGLGGRRLMTPDEASDVGSIVRGGGVSTEESSPPLLETIYVAVASYRDYQCTATVENVFRRAAHPHRIRVAVVDQVSEGDPRCATPTTPCDEDPDQILCRHRDRIDVYEADAALSVGPVFARHLGHRMYRGEYFAMQCDAHVEFTQDWDVDIIEQWKSAKNEMAVLSAYLSDIRGAIDPDTGERLHHSRPIMCRTDYEGYGEGRHLRHGQQPEGEPGIHGEPTLEPYWAAGFSFARGHFVVQVPYDQHLPLIFQGEEISIGLRGFTYGYDYYTAEKSVCFHTYAIGENKEKRKAVPLFWEHSSRYAGAGKKGMARLLGIIKMNPGVDPESWNHVEEEKYGIGQVRTLRKFFDTYGIHTETKTVEQHLCRFVGRKMQAKFKPHLRKDGMGIDYHAIDFKFVDPAPNEKPPPLNGKREI